MPYKSDKIKIAGTSYDRRIKLTEEACEKIRYLYRTSIHSQRKLAKIFGVSRSLIVMVLNPAIREKYNAQYRERMKDGRYRKSKEENARVAREHRRYKRQLFVEGKIKNSMKNEQEKKRRDF